MYLQKTEGLGERTNLVLEREHLRKGESECQTKIHQLRHRLHKVIYSSQSFCRRMNTFLYLDFFVILGSSNVVRNINTVDIDINGNNEPETSNSNDDECGIIANHSPSDDEEEYSKVDQSRNPFGITFENLKIGETYDVLDSTDRWCEAQV